MNETEKQTTQEVTQRIARSKQQKDEKGSSLSWGIFLVLAGVALFAKEMGWISLSLGWLLPAVLVAVGCGYLYEAFKKSG